MVHCGKHAAPRDRQGSHCSDSRSSAKHTALVLSDSQTLTFLYSVAPKRVCGSEEKYGVKFMGRSGRGSILGKETKESSNCAPKTSMSGLVPATVPCSARCLVVPVKASSAISGIAIRRVTSAEERGGSFLVRD